MSVVVTTLGGYTGQMSAQQPETEHERLTRNLTDLLGELRVAQAGVQILFGFLLTVVFTPVYQRAGTLEHVVHIVAVVFAVLATVLLSVPAAWHRVLFRAGQRAVIVRLGNRLVLAGLVSLALAMTATVALIGKVAFSTPVMLVLGAVVGALFAVLWFVVPWQIRTRLPRDHSDPS